MAIKAQSGETGSPDIIPARLEDVQIDSERCTNHQAGRVGVMGVRG